MTHTKSRAVKLYKAFTSGFRSNSLLPPYDCDVDMDVITVNIVAMIEKGPRRADHQPCWGKTTFGRSERERLACGVTAIRFRNGKTLLLGARSRQALIDACRSIHPNAEEYLRVITITSKAKIPSPVKLDMLVAAENQASVRRWDFEPEIFSSAATFKDIELGTARLFHNGTLMLFTSDEPRAQILANSVESIAAPFFRM